MGRSTLALRISMLAVAVAVITAVVGGILSVNLTRTASESGARRELKQLANAAVVVANNRPNASTGEVARRVTLGALRVQIAELDASGALVTTKGAQAGRLARDALTAAQRARLLSAGTLSLRTTSDGVGVFVEGRRTQDGGGLVLVQRRSDALAVADDAIRRVVIALIIAGGVAVLLGLLVAFRIARPLRRTAQAAHALADGHRDVRVILDGPAEVAEVGAAVNTLAAALTTSEARQRDFLLSVSHDLRTPLTAITGYAESLAEDVVPPERTAEVGAVMLAESQRLNRLVGDLLDLARMDAQDFRIDLVETDLAALARSAGQVWSRRCAGEGVPFTLDVGDQALVVWTDPLRLRQVLDGLLENALRVTPAGRPVILAVFTAAPIGPQTDGFVAVLEVRDGGPGLTDDDLLVAFERSALYDRYRGVRKVGTGLGLAIVARLVSRLGGTVSASHAPEGGARFVVQLAPQPSA